MTFLITVILSFVGEFPFLIFLGYQMRCYGAKMTGLFLAGIFSLNSVEVG